MAICVHCGYCCSKSPCVYGEGIPCIYLTIPNSMGQQKCMRYDEIKEINPDYKFTPAFGEGCSSTLFNNKREEVIKKLKNKESICSDYAGTIGLNGQN